MAPGILVLCFVLNSFMNQDLKGFVYAIGLALTCSIAIFSGLTLKMTAAPLPTVCTLLSPGKNNAFLSRFPLTTVVYMFTVAYLLYYIITYRKNNKTKIRTNSIRLHFGVIFVILCLAFADGWWHRHMNCISHESSMMVLAGAAVIGIAGGTAWGLFVGNVLQMSRYMLPGGTKTCWSPTKSIYRCRETSALGSLL
jgi:hypothetical protein